MTKSAAQDSADCHAELVRELDNVKKELCGLKSDMKSALESKLKAEKVAEVSSSKTRFNLLVAEQLKKEIEEANEEHVLVELACIEAKREHREIEAQYEAERTQFAKKIEAARKKIMDLQRATSRAKELEAKLAITNSDVAVLKDEMELVRAMEKNCPKQTSKNEHENSNNWSLQPAAESELEDAKKELEVIKAEGFQFMVSMDRIREEIMSVTEETRRLKELENKADSSIQHLNSKLLRVKSRLESATVADVRSKAIVSNLAAALQQLQAEAEAANKEKKLMDLETRGTRMEIEKIKLEMDSVEEKTTSLVQELGAARTSEIAGMKKLKVAAQRTMKTRAHSLSQNSTVTISKFEYEYLSQRASAAQMVADKKVAAARAWVKALKAEKEFMMRLQLVHTAIKEPRAVERKIVAETGKSLVDLKAMERDLDEFGQNEEGIEQETAEETLRKSQRERSSIASKARMRRISSASSGARNVHSSSFTIKRRKLIPNLVKIIREKRTRKQS